MSLWSRTCLGLLVALTAAPARAVEPAASERRLAKEEITAFFGELEKRVTAVKSVEVALAQEKHLSMFADVVTCRGRMRFAQPDRIRWEILEPFHSVLIVNGQKAAKYDIIDGKPRRLQMGDDAMRSAVEQLTLWHQGRFRPAGGDFAVDVFEAAGTIRVVLTPLNAAMRRFIEAFELKIDKAAGRIIAIKMYEGAGDWTSIRFLEERRDVELPASGFDVDNPLSP